MLCPAAQHQLGCQGCTCPRRRTTAAPRSRPASSSGGVDACVLRRSPAAVREAQTQPNCMELLVSLPAVHEPMSRTRHLRPGGHQHVCAALGGDSCCRGSAVSGTGLPPQCFLEPQGWPPWESTASASVRLSASDPSAAPAAGSAAACACLLLSLRAGRGSVASLSQNSLSREEWRRPWSAAGGGACLVMPSPRKAAAAWQGKHQQRL